MKNRPISLIAASVTTEGGMPISSKTSIKAYTGFQTVVLQRFVQWTSQRMIMSRQERTVYKHALLDGSFRYLTIIVCYYFLRIQTHRDGYLVCCPVNSTAQKLVATPVKHHADGASEDGVQCIETQAIYVCRPSSWQEGA